MPTRDYLFYELTASVCSTCLEKVEAKVIFQEGKVYLLKLCLKHGREKVLIATDVDYYQRCRGYAKPGDLPRSFGTKVEVGCPYDCGLCPDHEQHACLTVVEVTERCNLTCPTCYAESSPSHGRHRTLAEIEAMLDAVVRAEGTPDVVQLSGGEPTIHPDFFAILDLAKTKPIRHLMVNTNGLRIAQDLEFARRLATYQPDFEIYLQFDSLRPAVLERLRGADLTRVRQDALRNLNEVGLSTSLVVTLQKGQNDDELGDILRFALRQPCVRGVTFQPTQVAGRTEGFEPARDRFTLTEARRAIIEQSEGLFTDADLLPVPCNSDALVMAYALKLGDEVIPLTRHVDPALLLDASRNTISFEPDSELHRAVLALYSTGTGPEAAGRALGDLLCCLPRVALPELGYANVFRVIILQFMDRYSFDVRAAKKVCVNIVHDDGRLIPFDTMNIFYRGQREALVQQIRRRSLG